MIAGLRLVDGFGSILAERVVDGTVTLIGLPPGRNPNSVAAALVRTCEHRLSQVVRQLPPIAAESTPIGELIGGVASCLGIQAPLQVDAASLVMDNVDRFYMRRHIVVPLQPDLSVKALGAILSCCTELTEYTKDLDGPLGFSVLAPCPLSADAAACHALCYWPPLESYPIPLDFESPAESILQQGFNIYLGLRAYWEVYGQPDYLSLLQPVFDRAADLCFRSNVDRLIETLFDDLLQDVGPDPLLLERLFNESLKPRTGRAVLASALVPANAACRFTSLFCAGLAWRPPGSLHVYITVLAARQLYRRSDFLKVWKLSSTAVEAFVRATRVNSLLSSWVMELAAAVERELLRRCKTYPNIQRILCDLNMVGELEDMRRRHMMELDGGDDPPLIDCAGFGQLQHIVFNSPLAREFPVSSRRIHQIRVARNRAAHLHDVPWKLVRTVLEALVDLSKAEVSAMTEQPQRKRP